MMICPNCQEPSGSRDARSSTYMCHLCGHQWTGLDLGLADVPDPPAGLLVDPEDSTADRMRSFRRVADVAWSLLGLGCAALGAANLFGYEGGAPGGLWMVVGALCMRGPFVHAPRNRG